MIIVKRSLQLHLIVVTTGTMAMALAELELMMSSYSGGGSRGEVLFHSSVGSSGQWLPRRSVGIAVGQASGDRIWPNHIFQEAWGQPAVIKHFIWWGRCSDNIEVLRERNMTFDHCLWRVLFLRKHLQIRKMTRRIMKRPKINGKVR